jgi:hypothetical protein
MIFPPDYEPGMTQAEIQKKWPHLQLNNNFTFTSLRTWDYNCIAWVLNINDDWLQFEYNENGDIRPDRFPATYINFFKSHGFFECNNGNLEDNTEKICIYTDADGLLTHVSLQLANGQWISKMGDYEDIKHENEAVISGGLYGNYRSYMKRIRRALHGMEFYEEN